MNKKNTFYTSIQILHALFQYMTIPYLLGNESPDLNAKPHHTWVFSWLTSRTWKNLLLLKESKYPSLLCDKKETNLFHEMLK